MKEIRWRGDHHLRGNSTGERTETEQLGTDQIEGVPIAVREGVGPKAKINKGSKEEQLQGV